MQPIHMLQAKSDLSRLVECLEQGTEREIIIARHGRPVARLLPIVSGIGTARIGVAKGLFDVPDDIDVDNARVASVFLGPDVP